MAPKKTSKKITGATLIVKALPKKSAETLIKRKLDNLTFDDFNTIGKQIQKYWGDDPTKFAVNMGTMYDPIRCGGCFCFC